jgi:hypothetical protein
MPGVVGVNNERVVVRVGALRLRRIASDADLTRKTGRTGAPARFAWSEATPVVRSSFAGDASDH